MYSIKNICIYFPDLTAAPPITYTLDIHIAPHNFIITYEITIKSTSLKFRHESNDAHLVPLTPTSNHLTENWPLSTHLCRPLTLKWRRAPNNSKRQSRANARDPTTTTTGLFVKLWPTSTCPVHILCQPSMNVHWCQQQRNDTKCYHRRHHLWGQTWISRISTSIISITIKIKRTLMWFWTHYDLATIRAARRRWWQSRAAPFII